MRNRRFVKTRGTKAFMPPLSPQDQALYWVLMAVSLLVMLAFPLAGVFLRERLSFADSEVIAVAGGNGLYFAFVPMFFVGLPWFGSTVKGYRNRRPLLGNPEVQYGPPEYPEVYPLLARGKSVRAILREMYSGLAPDRGKALLLVVVMAVSLLLFPLSLYGRVELCADGGMVRYNCLNQIRAEYGPEDVTELRLSIDRDRTANSRDNPVLLPEEYNYVAFLTLELEDGWTITFNILSFRQRGQGDPLSALQAVWSLCSRFPQEYIAITGQELLEDMIQAEQLNQQKAVLLRRIFSIQP